MLNETFHNTSGGGVEIAVPQETGPSSEGGFLSGRNPFLFIATVPLPTFVVQLVVIVVISRIVKLILSPIKQPAVIAETISGILLGPTALGHIPHFSEYIFTKASLPFLQLMANFGLVLFLFLVGLELDPRMLKKSMKSSILISAAGMGLPFALATGISYVLYNYVEPDDIKNGFTKYFLFLGVAMAITAFPVLARILTELNLLKTRVGGITISAAAVGDAVSWCLLALVISLTNSNGSSLIALYVFLMGLGYSLFLILGVRPILIYFLRQNGAFAGTPSQFSMFVVLMIVFISAFITDAIGIHAIFGGFLAGIIMPHEGGFALHITEKLEDIVAVVFLPLYFAFSGLRTSIGTLNTFLDWGIVVLVIVITCIGKMVGCTLAARLSKMSWRESLTVGSLMNCKGLVELIVLNLGYDAHVISQRTFAIMVIMALSTTFITVPLVTFLYPPKYQEQEEKRRAGERESLLVCVNKVEQVPPVLEIIRLLQPKTSPGGHSNNHHDGKMASKGSSTSLSSLASFAGISFNTKSEDGVEGQRKTKKAKGKGFPVVGLRLIELTDRDSSIMLHTSEQALKNDPVSEMLRAFCRMYKAQFQVCAKVVSSSQFAQATITAEKEMNAKFVMVPWAGSGAIIDNSPVESTPGQHSSFISQLLAESTSAILIMVERAFHPASGGQIFNHIYAPYFGHPDDREVLTLAMKLSSTGNVRLRVISYISSASQDDLLIQCLESPNIIFSEEIDDGEPKFHFLGGLGASDLVMVGRGDERKGRRNSTRIGNGEDVVRARLLGWAADKILKSSSGPSVLVVQASRDHLPRIEVV